jgi:transcriptional regulator with XRE-family HTH domain
MRGVIPSGDRVLSLRKAAGLTQESLAAECDCDVKTVRSAERSKRLDLATLRRIAARLGVDFRDIVADIPADRREANIAAAMASLRAFDARDPDGVAACFTEDGVVVVFADSRLPAAGEYRGRDRVRQWAETCFAAFWAQHYATGNYHVEAVGDRVYLHLIEPQVESLQTGRRSAVSALVEHEMRDGKIAEMRIFPESGAVERIVLPEGARPQSEALAARRTTA